jgi:hypothetical protein
VGNARAAALGLVPPRADEVEDDDIDLSEFKARAPQKTNLCWFATRLTDAQQKKVTKARLAGIQYDTIAAVMKEDWGVEPPNVSGMGHHFLGRCGCARDKS